MCWLHYFPTSPRWMADLCKEWWVTALSFPGHKDREGSQGRGASQGPWLPVLQGTVLLCAEVRIGPRKQMSLGRLTGQQRRSQLTGDRFCYSFSLSENWFQASNPLTVRRWEGRDGRSFCVFDSTLKPQHLAGLLLKINIHLDTNKPYGFSKYTSHIIQPHEFPKCQTANLHFLG